MSQFEVIDLTDESIIKSDDRSKQNKQQTENQQLNVTITIDDSFVQPVECLSSDDNFNNNYDDDDLVNDKQVDDDNVLNIQHSDDDDDVVNIQEPDNDNNVLDIRQSDNDDVINIQQPDNDYEYRDCDNNLEDFLNYSSSESELQLSQQQACGSSTNTTPIKDNCTIRKKRKSRSINTTPRLLTKSGKLKEKVSLKEQQKQLREEAKRLKQKQKDEERLEKEANRANAANKALNNCKANIDENILKLINDPEQITLKTLFDESMINYRLTGDLKIENSINWTYKRVEVLDGNCVTKFNDSNWLMVIISGCEYLKKLLIYKKDSNDLNSIKTFINSIRKESQCNIVLVIYNLSTYLKNERAKEAKNYRKTFKDKFENRTACSSSNDYISIDNNNDLNTSPTLTTLGTTELQDLRLTLEMELKHENKDFKLHLEFNEKTADVIQTIVRYTLSLAKYQVKQKVRSSTGLDWAINMDKERAVDPTKSREDLTKLWITQLQQFSQVTLPIAKAIATEYPSPFALLDQYKNLTNSEAEDLLAELYVQKNLRRQIGPNISKRIHCFMTCTDPDVHIGLS